MLRTRGRGTPPPLPPGLEVYRPPEVLGSAVLVVEDEAPMRAQLRLDLGDLGYHAVPLEGQIDPLVEYGHVVLEQQP